MKQKTIGVIITLVSVGAMVLSIITLIKAKTLKSDTELFYTEQQEKNKLQADINMEIINVLEILIK